MIPLSPASTTVPSVNTSSTGVSQQQTDPYLPEPTSSSAAVRVAPSFQDDDDFYLLYIGSYSSPGTLKEETIQKLDTDHPGLFKGLEEPDDLFYDSPVYYQPLAKLIHDVGNADLKSILNAGIGDPCWCATKIPYGLYKGGFYRIEGDYEGTQWVRVHYAQYEMMVESKRFVSQLREFLFDPGMGNDEKVDKLQALFPPLNQGEEEISIKDLLNNMNLTLGTEFKQAQQRAIDGGLKP